jgi:transposase
MMEEAVRRKREAEDRGEPFVVVWCVFDRDEHPIDRYSRAFDLARAQGIEAVWSNEAFELWYLLHFEFRNTAAHRHDLIKLVENRLMKQYAKGDRAVAAWFAQREQQPLREQACAHARKLIALHGEKARFANPSTQIHEIVEKFEEIRRLEEASSKKSTAP